jgi:hypothetical protein
MSSLCRPCRAGRQRRTTPGGGDRLARLEWGLEIRPLALGTSALAIAFFGGDIADGCRSISTQPVGRQDAREMRGE